MLDQLKMISRYVFGLHHYLRNPLTFPECRRMIVSQFENRERTFLRLIEKGVFANPSSPYRRLLSHAGVEFGDLAKSVSQEGIEATLQRLYREGVYVSFEEFKGRRPVQRSGLTVTVRPEDFDNPLLVRHYETTSGGSRGAGTRIMIDFDFLTHEAGYFSLFEPEFGLEDRPLGMWFPLPPSIAGIRQALLRAKCGQTVEKWFCQNRFGLTLSDAPYFIFTAVATHESRLCGNPLATPEYLPLDRASVIAQWLQAKRRGGRPAYFLTSATSAVRVCRAAQELNLDISDTVFRVGAEPYTSAKAQVIAHAGCRALNFYAMAEIGGLGEMCASPVALDDVHLLDDKLALIQQEKTVDQSGHTVGAFLYTTLLLSCPKIMLNVESDDYGILEERDCGCAAAQIGLRRHVHSIRSYDKLTSDGMTFLGGELIRLVEEILPQRFGGYPNEYQFVEQEEEGITKVQIRISPRVGNISEVAVVETVLGVLRSYAGAKKMMADRWREAQTLRVVRAEPYATLAGKILPLHILQHTKEA